MLIAVTAMFLQQTCGSIARHLLRFGFPLGDDLDLSAPFLGADQRQPNQVWAAAAQEPMGLHDSPLEETVTSEPVSGFRWDIGRSWIV